MNVGHWFLQLLIAIDQLLNVLITPLQGSAWADETLSARAWRADCDGRWFGCIMRPLIDGLFFWQESHCRSAWLSEFFRQQLPPQDRTASSFYLREK